MKTIIAISVALLALACAPGDQSSPETPAGGPHAIEEPSAERHDQSQFEPGETDSTAVQPPFTTSQSLYVPVYSHVYYGHDKRTFDLACTLSIRNSDTRSPITLSAVDYYNTEGTFVRHFLDRSRTLAPLETVDFYIQERDTSGGSGANFIVRWGSTAPVDTPIVEAVMIGVADGQGISFVSPAREIAK